MQDKEFDALFRSKLEDFEAEPSANVWPEIEAELSPGKRRSAWVAVLSIAACLLAVTAFGWWILDSKPVKNASQQMAYHPVQQTKKQLDLKHDTVAPAANIANMNAIAIVKPQHKVVQKLIEKQASAKPAAEGTPATDPSITKPDEQTALASTQNTRGELIPDATEHIALKINAPEVIKIDPPVNIKIPQTAIAMVPSKQAQPKTVKHRAHTLGDLINKVVASVDKRKDKFIEFTDTDDDDESNITGINLGILKIKKENK